MNPYDRLASVYDRWLTGDETAPPCMAFYLDELRDETKPVLELGVGTGRISHALADGGICTIGLDASMNMLRQCRLTQGSNPVSPRLSLVCGRFEQLPFASQAFATVILPMRTLGHLVDVRHRNAMFAEVTRILRPGGRFVFDHYNLDRDWAEAHDGQRRLMYAGPGATGEDTALLIWDRYDYDFDARTLHCTVLTEEVGPEQSSRTSFSVEFDFRWFDVEEIWEHAATAGMAVEHCWGGFDRTSFSTKADDMVFVLRKHR